MDFTDLKDYVSLTKDALELMRTAYRVLPKGEERNRAEVALKAATDALARSDAKLAKELGFELCRCTFPGVPMLWKKDMGKYGKHECPKCGEVSPRDRPEHDPPAVRFDSALTRARRGG